MQCMATEIAVTRHTKLPLNKGLKVCRDNFRKRIDRLLEQLMRLAESGLSTEEFYIQFLRHLHIGMTAVASAIWLLTKAGRFNLEAQIDLLQATLAPAHARVVPRQQTLRRMIAQAEPYRRAPGQQRSRKLQ